MAEQARAGMADFIELDPAGNFRINLNPAKDAGKLRQVRKIRFVQRGRPHVELVDSQGALGLAMKALWMAVQRREISGPDGGPVRVGISYEEALAALRSPSDEPSVEAVEGSVEGAVGL